MSENSKIEWCDHTFNPWEGCTKVSPGCLNCYAETRNARFGGGTATNWGKGAPRRQTSLANWKLPLKWNDAAACTHHCRKCGRDRLTGDCPVCEYEQDMVAIDRDRPRVFCASLADWLDDEVPIEWLADLLELIRATPNLDWLLLTKRPENWEKRIELILKNLKGKIELDTWVCLCDWLAHGNYPANVWIGTTVEDQTRAEQRIPYLLRIPAATRFLSCEPLLEKIDIEGALSRGSAANTTKDSQGIDWVIVGGESGTGCRPFDPDWARLLKIQCQSARVPFFMKQMGGTRKPFPEIPADLMIREFPQGGIK